MITEQEITKAYESLTYNTQLFQMKAIQRIEIETDLEKKKARALVDGSNTGKNPEGREAMSRELFGLEYGSLEEAKNQEREAKYDLDLAEIEVSRVRALLRLAEVLASVKAEE